MIPAGTYNLGPGEATLLVHTIREGMAKKVGHDLSIEVTRWNATVNVDADITRSTATATADTRSMEVREGHGGVKPLSDGDRRDIEKNINDKVLKTDKYPEITFRSTRVEGNESGPLTVHGDLTIVGNTRPARLEVTFDQASGRAKGTMTVVQSEFGIKPFSAMMGALKVRDAIELTIEAPIPK